VNRASNFVKINLELLRGLLIQKKFFLLKIAESPSIEIEKHIF